MPSSIRLTKVLNFQREDFLKEVDVQALLANLFYDPEIATYYFCEHGREWDPLLSDAIQRNDIIVEKSENFYFKDLRFERNYVKIEVRDGNYDWEWQRDLAEKCPMHSRSTLILSTRKRLELETWQKIRMEEEYRQQLTAASNAYDVFLSYSTSDKDHAREIEDAIQQAGYKVFLAEKCIQPGQNFENEIRQALMFSSEVWLLLSPTSLRSEWVTTEWGAAWALDKKMIPILYRCDVSSLPDRLQNIQCIDFHRYQKLIQGLG
jgi:hypothetical protein